MTKRTVIIISIILLAIVAAIFTAEIYNRNYIIVSCDSAAGECTYSKQSGFGNITDETSFKFKDVMQCNIETIYKKDVKDQDVIYAYDFNLYFMTGNDKLNFQTKQRENLDKICANFFEKKSFEYKFQLLNKQVEEE